MLIDTTIEEFHAIKQLIKEIIMATLDDNVLAIGKKIDSIIATLASSTGAGGTVDLSPVLTALTGVQNTANLILAQDNPSAVAPDQLATITALSSATGSIAGGEVITITGTNFTGATGVMFGTVAGTGLKVVSDTSLTVVSPAQPAAAVDVTVVDAAGTSVVVPAGKYTLS
jgi:hypothetical protein